MTPKTFLVVAVIAGLSVAAAVATLAARPDGRVADGGGTPLFPGLADQAAAVASLQVRGAAGTLTIERSADGWRLKERDGYPVPVHKVRETVIEMARAVMLEPKTARPARHGELELLEPPAAAPAAPAPVAAPAAPAPVAAPAAPAPVAAPGTPAAATAPAGTGLGRVVTLTDDKGGVIAAAVVGRRRFDLGGGGGEGEGLYVRRPAEAQAWLVRSGLAPATEVRDWIDRKPLSLDGARIARVVVRHGDTGEAVTVAKADPAAAHATVEGLPDGTTAGNAAAADRLLTALAALDVDEIARPATLPMAPEATTTIEATTRDGVLVTARLANVNDGDWVVLNATPASDAPDQAKAAEAARAVSSRIDGWAFRVPAWQAGALRTRLADLVTPASE